MSVLKRVAPGLLPSVMLSMLVGTAALWAQDTKAAPVTSARTPGLSVRQAGNARSGCDVAAAVAKGIAIVNGCPYQRPTAREQFHDYLRDSYLLPAQGANVVRTAYSQSLDKPTEWGQDFPGFMQRYAAYAGITAINGNVRYAMEEVFHEDLRYIPCHGCGVKRKIENALLAEITARHDSDGRRFFTLTPTIADYTGPIIAHGTYWPGPANWAAGAVSARLVFATRIGQHLFREFVLERRHKDAPNER